MPHLVGYTQNKLPVYVDLIGSDAAKHIAREPHLLSLATEMLRGTTIDQPVVRLECDMGRSVGYDFIVKTTASDAVFYAQMVRDDVYTRFIKNGEPKLSSFVSVSLRHINDGTAYMMHDIHIGHTTPPRIGSAEETKESRRYWQDHALIFRNQSHQARTLTKTCPY